MTRSVFEPMHGDDEVRAADADSVRLEDGDGFDDGLLGDPARIAASDGSDALMTLARTGATVRAAHRILTEAPVVDFLDGVRPRCVLLLGAPDAVSELAAAVRAVSGDTLPAPVIAADESRLPEWIGAADVVVVLGASAAAAAAIVDADRQGATLIALAPREDLSPGEPDEDGRALRAELARARGLLLPVGTDLWPALTAMRCILGRLGRDGGRAGGVRDDEAATVADALDEVALASRPDSEQFIDPAKSIATALAGTLPVLVGGSVATGFAAERFARRIRQICGVPAVDVHTAPELLGFLDGPYAAPAEADIFRDRVEGPDPLRVRLVLLDRPAERTGVLAGALRLADERGVAVTEFAQDGPDGDAGMLESLEPAADADRDPYSVPTLDAPSPAMSPARLATLVGGLDFAAAYLGVLTGHDPAGSHDPLLAELQQSLGPGAQRRWR